MSNLASNLSGAPAPLDLVGNTQSTNYLTAAVQTLVATTGTAQIPGPASGMLRVLAAAYFTGAGSTPTITCTINPGAYVIARAVAGPIVTATSAAFPSAGPGFILGFGETIDYTNTGTANCTMAYWYYDIPVGNRTLVRGSFSDTPLTIIPAISAGSYAKIVTPVSGSLQALPRPAFLTWNDDTVSHIMKITIGGTTVLQQAATSTQSLALTYALVHGQAITTGAMAILNAEANTTRSCTFIGCYETFAGTP